MSAALLVIHAAPGSATERLALAAAAAGKPVFLATAAAASPALASAGAIPVDVRAIKARLC